MRKISSKYLAHGMTLAKPIFNADGVVLLKEGLQVNEEQILKIRSYGISFVYIEDKDVSSQILMDIVSTQTRMEAMRTLKYWIFNLEDTATVQASGGKTLLPVIDKLVIEMQNNPDKCIKFFDIRTLDDFTYAHSVNVCILSMLTALSLGYSPQELRTLGLAALLHDIGKMYVPLEILRKEGTYTEEEQKTMEKHAEYGYLLALEDASLGPEVAEIIFQHHERFNGSGYPRRLKGSQIHKSAYIIGVADVYEALTAERVHRHKFLPHEALELIYGAGDILFDFKVVQAFVKHIAVYPVGAMVELNTGEQGIVVNVTHNLPARPVIKILRDQDGNKVNKIAHRDLTMERTITITNVIETKI